MNIGSFFVTLGVDADTLKVKDFARGIGEIPLKAAGAIVALAGISFGIKEILNSAMGAAVAFQSFEAQTGLSSQELQRWQIVAQQANVSAEAVTGSISALNRQLADIRMGRGNISPFQIMLGGLFDPNQGAFKTLEQIRQRVKGMDRQVATNLISQMGLTPDMMQVLTLSDQKFKEFASTVTGMTPKEEQAFLKLRLELTKLKMEIEHTFMHTLAGVLPVLMPIIHDLLPKFAALLARIVPPLATMAQMLFEIKGLLPALAIGFGVLMSVMYPITAAVIAFLLVLDDLYVYSKGGKSLTGIGFKALADAFEHPIQAAEKFLNLLDRIVEVMTGSKFTDMIKSLTNLPPDIMEGLTTGDWSGVRQDAFGGTKWAVPAMAPAGAGAGGSAAAVVQTNFVTITSTAPAADLRNEFDRQTGKLHADAAANIPHRPGPAKKQ